MSKFYDDLGNLTDSRVAEFAGEIGHRASALLDELLAEGLTIVEGRAVNDYLKSQLDTSTIMALMKRQLALMHPEEPE